MDIYEKLQEAGLTGNEAKVYLELVKKTELSANQIAKNLGIDRTLTYTVLNHLIDKGQVGYIVKENKKVFSVTSPKNLLNKLRVKEVIINDLVNELGRIKSEENRETEINVYEGKEGLRSIFNKMVTSKEILAFGATGRAYNQLLEAPALGKEFIKKNIKLRVLTNVKYKNEEFLKYNVEFKLSKIKSEATTSIFGDYISIHMVRGKPISLLIKNKEIAKSYKNHFEWMWKRAK